MSQKRERATEAAMKMMNLKRKPIAETRWRLRVIDVKAFPRFM